MPQPPQKAGVQAGALLLRSSARRCSPAAGRGRAVGLVPSASAAFPSPSAKPPLWSKEPFEGDAAMSEGRKWIRPVTQDSH